MEVYKRTWWPHSQTRRYLRSSPYSKDNGRVSDRKSAVPHLPALSHDARLPLSLECTQGLRMRGMYVKQRMLVLLISRRIGTVQRARSRPGRSQRRDPLTLKRWLEKHYHRHLLIVNASMFLDLMDSTLLALRSRSRLVVRASR